MRKVSTNGFVRLAHVARIVGPQSAAARALAEYHRRIGAGEDVAIFEGGKSLIVGPRLVDDAA